MGDGQKRACAYPDREKINPNSAACAVFGTGEYAVAAVNSRWLKIGIQQGLGGNCSQRGKVTQTGKIVP